MRQGFCPTGTSSGKGDFVLRSRRRLIQLHRFANFADNELMIVSRERGRGCGARRRIKEKA
jgi:hypothetical protein